jgi:uncharacterized membrane protein YphA (DoxX/SURF4 family)
VRNAWPFVGLAIRVTAGLVWLVAGAAKLADLEHFRVQVGAYDVLPNGLEAAFAYALPFLEVGIGLYLIVGLLVRGTAALSCVLMALFIVAMVQARLRGLVLDCGCFGVLARQPIGWWTIARDVALGVPGLVMLILPSRFLSLDARLLGKRDPWDRRRSARPQRRRGGVELDVDLDRVARRRLGADAEALGQERR